MTDQTPGCGATSDARKRRTEAHQIHPDPAVCVIVAREVAAERERIAQAIEALPGPANVGIKRWNARDQETYLLAIEEAASAARIGPKP